MEIGRKPFTGVLNIVRFNWPFYLFALVFVIGSIVLTGSLENPVRDILLLLAGLVALAVLITLSVSWYIYDLSNLYDLPWIGPDRKEKHLHILNIHAGFDETSVMIEKKFPDASVIMLDFYDPKVHTEPSIQRARKRYPSPAGTISTRSTELPVDTNSADLIFVIFAAHEIRNKEERVAFFRELHRVTKPGAEILVTEHLRDINNFLVFNIGFLHFFPKASWIYVFSEAGLVIANEIKTTPFISTFVLRKNGIAS
jgi:SAM-dependent methyltransferase